MFVSKTKLLIRRYLLVVAVLYCAGRADAAGETITGALTVEGSTTLEIDAVPTTLHGYSALRVNGHTQLTQDTFTIKFSVCPEDYFWADDRCNACPTGQSTRGQFGQRGRSSCS